MTATWSTEKLTLGPQLVGLNLQHLDTTTDTGNVVRCC